MKAIWLTTAAIVIAIPATPAEAQVVGVVSAVRNDVRIRKPSGGVPLPAQLKQRIALADSVQTGAKSQLQLMLLDKSVFTVGANARLTIDRFVYDPARNSRSLGATVGRGTFRFMSGRRTTGNTQINTPTATIGVRGTVLDGTVGEDAMLIANNERGVGRGVRGDPAGATLVVLRGPGPGTHADVNPGVIDVTSGGRTVTADRPMQAIYVPYAGAVPIGPFTISEEGLRQLQAMLHPALAQRLGWQGPVNPNRTFVEAPTFDEPPRRGFPRRPGGGGLGPQAGAFPDDDRGPGMDVPMPLDRLRDAPAPQPRRTAPTPTPTQTRTPAPAPNAGPQNRTTPTPQPTPAPSPNMQGGKPIPTATPAPTPPVTRDKVPQPTPSPTPPPVLNNNVPKPSPSPTPRPTPTPTPGPNDPGYKPPG